jgi:HSP20 family protein
MDSIQHQLNRLLEDVVTPLSSDDFSSEDWDTVAFVPAIELYETADDIVLCVELPGLTAEDIDIEATVNTVVIKGARQSPESHEAQSPKRSEFRYGSFSRLVNLPKRVKNSEVSADYQNGILKLTLPKADDEKNRVVKVSLSR